MLFHVISTRWVWSTNMSYIYKRSFIKICIRTYLDISWCCNDKEFLKVFTQRIKYVFTQKWHSYINETPKALHYKRLKSLLTPELYLNTDISYVLKKTLSNFRCSSHDLMIEKGRHLSIDRNFRFCQICEKQNIYIIED